MTSLHSHRITLALIVMMSIVAGNLYSQNVYYWPSTGYGEPTGGATDIVSFQGRLLAVTNSGVVYASDDNGATWVAQEIPVGLSQGMRFSVLSNNRLFYSTVGGDYESTDQGSSWQPYSQSFQSLALIAGRIVGMRDFYAASTNDDGATWNGIAIDNGNVSLTVSSTALILGNYTKIYYTTDGINFSTRLAGFVNGVVQASGSTVLAGKVTSGLWRSNDGGDTWTDVPSFTSPANQIAFAPGAILIVSGNKIFRSTDDGTSWQANTDDLGNTVINRIVEHNGAYFASTNNSGVLRSIDGGATWNRYGNGMFQPEITAVIGDLSTILIADERGISRSLDEKIWQQAATDLSGVTITSFAADGTNTLAGSEGNGIYISTDDGVNWTQSNNGLSDLSVRDIAATPTRIFATTPSGVFVSNDHGASWSATNATFPATYVDDPGSGTTYVAGSTGLYASADGASFSGVTGIPASAIVTEILHSSTRVYIGTNQGVYASTSATTFALLNATFTANVTAITNEGDNVYVASGNDIFQVTPASVPSLTYYSQATGLFVHSGNLYAISPGGFTSGETLSGLFKRPVSEIPAIYSFSPTVAKVGDLITIIGDHLGEIHNDGFVSFVSLKAFGSTNILGTIVESDDHSIKVSVPAAPGVVSILIRNSRISVQAADQLTVKPTFKYFNTLAGPSGTVVTATCLGLPSDGKFAAKVGSVTTSATLSGYSFSEVTFGVLDNMSTGNVSITCNGEELIPANTKFIVQTSISNLGSLSGNPGDLLNIYGTGFGTNSADVKVKLGGVEVPITTNANQFIRVTVTEQAKSGKVTITKDGYTSVSSQNFIVLSDEINCLSTPDKPVITQSAGDGFVTLTSSSKGGNEWFYNGLLIVGESGADLITRVPGTFTVLVNVDGCRSAMSDPVNIQIETITGLNDEAKTIDVYPNPFESKLTIQLPGSSDVEIINGQGVVVASMAVESGPAEMNTSLLPSGLYLVRIKTDGKEIVKRVVRK